MKSAHQLWSHTTLLLKTTLLQSLLPLVSSGIFWTGMSNLLRQLRNMGFNLSNRLPALADLTCLSYTTLRCKHRNQGMRRPFQIKKSREESVIFQNVLDASKKFQVNLRCCQCSEYPESSRQFLDVLPLELGHPTDWAPLGRPLWVTQSHRVRIRSDHLGKWQLFKVLQTCKTHWSWSPDRKCFECV